MRKKANKKKKVATFSLMTPEERAQYYLKEVKENQRTANVYR